MMSLKYEFQHVNTTRKKYLWSSSVLKWLSVCEWSIEHSCSVFRDKRFRKSMLGLSACAALVSDCSNADSFRLCVGFRQSVQSANNNSQQISESCEELNSTIYKTVLFSVL